MSVPRIWLPETLGQTKKTPSLLAQDRFLAPSRTDLAGSDDLRSRITLTHLLTLGLPAPRDQSDELGLELLVIFGLFDRGHPGFLD